MVKALARAFRWRRMLETGVVSTVREIATKEKINSSYVSWVLRHGATPKWDRSWSYPYISKKLVEFLEPHCHRHW
jgi:hypothetical protein